MDLHTADLVVVANDNDMEKRVPLETYRQDLAALLRVLPADRTIFSDLPIFPGREPYQAVLQQLTDAQGVMRADFGAVFQWRGAPTGHLLLAATPSEQQGLWVLVQGVPAEGRRCGRSVEAELSLRRTSSWLKRESARASPGRQPTGRLNIGPWNANE